MKESSPHSSGPRSQPPEKALIGELLAGRYRVEKLLGSGGMGSVYRAEHVHMKKAVAVKVLHREMTFLPEVVARFEREAVAAARIEHPNVAAATDFGRLDDGAFYLVLEYVEGQSLRELMKQQKRLPVERALYIARQIADALSAAHMAGIVHRDLKPDNVMLIDRDNDKDFVKVLDFGIAKLHVEGQSAQPLTQLGSVFGTPEYMAPEQAQGLPVDARADLYTLGILLYEMLAGKTPFNDNDMIVVLTRQLTADPPPLPADVHAAVSVMVKTLLAKGPERRFQTAAELVVSITALLDSDFTPGSLKEGSGRAVPNSEAQGSAQFSDTVLSVANPNAKSSGPGAYPSAAASARSLPGSRRLTDLVASFKHRASLLPSSVNLGGQPVPLWALLVTGVLAVSVVAIVLMVLVFGSSDQGSRSLPVSGLSDQTLSKPNAELQALLNRAAAGDPTAIAELGARPPAERSAPEWHALGRGHARLGQYPASLNAYENALAKAPALATDPGVLRDIRRAAEHPVAFSAALELAQKLGSSGADLVYDVWDGTRRDKTKAALASSAKDYLDSDALRRRASPALLVLLDLHAAKTCQQYKKLLPNAADHADGRALVPMKVLSSPRGCGFLGLRDCYGCVRGSKELSAALKNAQARPGPRFDGSPLPKAQ